MTRPLLIAPSLMLPMLMSGWFTGAYAQEPTAPTAREPFQELQILLGGDEPTGKATAAALPSTIPPGDDPGTSITAGPIPLTAYLDTDCGYCSLAVHWLLASPQRETFALKVVFLGRSDTERTAAEHVICSPPPLRATALLQVFERDTATAIEYLRCEAGHAQAAIDEIIAANEGVRATPTFVVAGQTFPGYDRNRLQQLVNQAGR